MFKQGRPDGPNDHYQVHIADDRESTRSRDRLLGNNCTKAICGNGSYHKWFATNPEQVTCQACKTKFEEIDGDQRTHSRLGT